METYAFETKSNPGIYGYIDAETPAKAKYKLWLQEGADNCYESFVEFLKDVKIRKVKESEE